MAYKIKKTITKAAQILCFLLMLLTYNQSFGQNNTRSPYSFFGFGEMEPLGFASNLGMGGTGMAYFSQHHYNYLNPASMAYIDRVVFDFGGRVDRVALRAGDNYKDYNNGNMSYLSLAFTVFKREKTIKSDTIRSESGNEEIIHNKANIIRVNSGFGFKPYTNFGTEFSSKLDTSFGSFNSENILTGGVSAIHFNNAVLIHENLSLGLNTSFLWGQRNQFQFLTSSSDLGYYTLSEELISQYRGVKFDLGVGYKYKIKSKTWIMLGASYEIGSTLKRKDNRVVRSLGFAPNGFVSNNDTLILFANDFHPVQTPSGFKAGLTLMLSEKIAFSVDYHQRNWGSVSKNEWKDSLSHSRRLNLGFVIRPESNPVKSMRKIEYRFGYNLAKLPGIVKDENRNWQQINENGISFGVGIPVIRDVFTLSGRQKYKSMINITGEYITRGNHQNGLIREELYRLTLGLSLTDLWFVKKKIF